MKAMITGKGLKSVFLLKVQKADRTCLVFELLEVIRSYSTRLKAVDLLDA